MNQDLLYDRSPIYMDFSCVLKSARAHTHARDTHRQRERERERDRGICQQPIIYLSTKKNSSAIGLVSMLPTRL